MTFSRLWSWLTCIMGALITSGCVSSPPVYTDPLAEIGRSTSASNSALKGLRLGLVFTENANTSMEYVSQNHAKMASLGGAQESLDEVDPRFLTVGLNDLLEDRFKEVIVLKSQAEAAEQGIDVVMLLDIQVKLGKMSGTTTSVHLQGNVTDTDGQPLDSIQGSGSGKIPFPASSIMFKPASGQALKAFGESLDGSQKLAAHFGNGHSVQTQVVSTASAPTAATSVPMSPSSASGFAVVVGIASYQNGGADGISNLLYADDDAREFAAALRTQGWSESHISLLVNDQATERNIRITLESWLSKAGPNDTLILFWAGHGYPDPEDPEKVYFACYDTDIRIPATGYRMDKVRAALEERKARNVVLFADTCHAGKLMTRGNRGVAGLSIAPEVEKMKREQTTPKGWIFMVGAEADRQSIEHSSWSHGAFTQCLLKGMGGAADGYQSVGPKDGQVTMGELRAYMESSMPDETQRVLGVAKRPLISTSTGDPGIWNLTLKQ